MTQNPQHESLTVEATRQTIEELAVLDAPGVTAHFHQSTPDLFTPNAVFAHTHKSVLRFITCGSVDDGKSSLIGRLLFETGNVLDDQLERLTLDSRKHGTQGAELDYALLLDGLLAEREQGITIDVAYRFFQTPVRKFIVADCPGHEQYTRNMATGAAGADLAVVLIDARKGLLPQTLRHSFIVSSFGVRKIILAVNKMDACDYDQARFDAIVAEYKVFAEKRQLTSVQAIPISALKGDNLTAVSDRMPWYRGLSLLSALENTVTTDSSVASSTFGFRMPVQYVLRPHQDFRGFAGRVSSGVIHQNDAIQVQGNGASRSTVAEILIGDQQVLSAREGDSIVLRLQDERDVSRGDVLGAGAGTTVLSNSFHSLILWMGDASMQIGQSYLLKLGAKTVNARIESVKGLVDVHTGDLLKDATELRCNDIAKCIVSLDSPIAATEFGNDRQLGSFVLIDRQSHATVAAGVIERAELASKRPIFPKAGIVTAAIRAAQKHQVARCYWLTGISGAGKSTLAEALDQALTELGKHVYVLDGDRLRAGLSAHLGFSDADRHEQARLVAQTARLMVDAGLVVIVSLISPFAADRQKARALFEPGQFFEVFVDTPNDLARQRDPKGLYQLAQAGVVQNLTGFGAAFEAPNEPELHIQTEIESVEVALSRLLAL
jgi:bifunctional enzyme CysN/CysC